MNADEEKAGVDLAQPTEADAAAAEKCDPATREATGLGPTKFEKIRAREPVPRAALLSFRLSTGLATSVESGLVQMADEADADARRRKLIPPHEVRRLAADAEVHPTTFKKYLRGAHVQGSSRARIERALRAASGKAP